jgi:hypothetical protein
MEATRKHEGDLMATLSTIIDYFAQPHQEMKYSRIPPSHFNTTRRLSGRKRHVDGHGELAQGRSVCFEHLFIPK